LARQFQYADVAQSISPHPNDGLRLLEHLGRNDASERPPPLAHWSSSSGVHLLVLVVNCDPVMTTVLELTDTRMLC
jgi:hypothetical protein